MQGHAGGAGKRRIMLAALLLLLLPLIGTHFARAPAPGAKTMVAPPGAVRLPTRPPPEIEPADVLKLAPEEARQINAAVPFSTAPNPAARPFRLASTGIDRERATDCLAAAQYYEAGDDPVGQEAVAQVVLNRLRHPAFPKSVCGVVFQGSERVSGCQFTFTCDGSLARMPPQAAWTRARALAKRMLSGLVYRKVGYATHYHTDWVVPYWSASLDKIAEVHTHLFFRWPGWWGTPGAFLRAVQSTEPNVPLIARLSAAHNGSDGLELPNGLIAPHMSSGASDLATAPQQVTASKPFVQLAGNARLIAAARGNDAFVIQLPWDMATSQYVTIARTFCSGRKQCRVMGWRAGDGVPADFPIPSASLPSMLFSYIHNAESGLQRLLWNCKIVPQEDRRNCMRERVPLARVVPETNARSETSLGSAP